MWIEGQNFSSIENQPLNNEVQNEKTDTIEQISAFFESHDFDTSYLQNSYEAFSPEQKEFLIQAYKAIQNNPDLLMEIMELPYDEDSFIFFRDSLWTYIELWNTINLENWNSNNETDNYNNTVKEYESQKGKINDNEEIDKLTESEKQKINNVYQELLKDWEYKEFFNKNGLDKYSDFEEIKSFFANVENVRALFELAEAKWPQAVEKLYNDLTTLNNLPNFSVAGLENFSIELKQPKPTPEAITEVWLDTTNFHITETQGSALIYGDQKIDFGEKPPVKYITNGDFELKSVELDYKVDKQLRSDIFVLEHKIPKLENQISNLESNMSKLDSFSQNLSQMDSFNEQTLDYLYEQFLREHGNPLRNDILWTINTQGEIDMGRLKSLLLEDNENKKQELLININDKKELLQEQKTQLQLMKQKLSDMQNAFKEQVLEKDEKVRKILEFVWQIWLDLIQPQSRLDQIFRELKDNSLKISGLNLDPQKIDLANGRFGESDMEQSTDKWKINLIKFFNKMISWDTNQPHDVQQFVSVWGKTINPTEFKQTLEDAWVINDMWEAQITKIRQNLTSVWNVSTEESEKNKEK